MARSLNSAWVDNPTRRGTQQRTTQSYNWGVAGGMRTAIERRDTPSRMVAVNRLNLNPQNNSGDSVYDDAKDVYNSALGRLEGSRGNLKGRTDEAIAGGLEYRDWAKGLLDDALDSDRIELDMERFTPKADAATQTFIDYAASLISDPGSMLRRAVDGDYDYTQFNQGVVAPMMRMAAEQEEKILEAYSGGDPYGKTGGSQGVSGAGRVAASKMRSNLSSTIAGLRYQEQNNMFNRAFSGMQNLASLGEFVDNRKYETMGLNAALQLSGQRAGAAASIGSSAMGMHASLGSSAISGAASQFGADASVLNQAIGSMFNVGATGITADASRDVANIGAGARRDVANIGATSSQNIAGIQASTQSYIANLEKQFAQSEANRNQMNVNVDRAGMQDQIQKLMTQFS